MKAELLDGARGYRGKKETKGSDGGRKEGGQKNKRKKGKNGDGKAW